MVAGLLELLGWDGLTVAEQASAIAGAGGGLALVLLGRVLFGGRGREGRRQ